mgnify:CR=1 FL=1
MGQTLELHSKHYTTMMEFYDFTTSFNVYPNCKVTKLNGYYYSKHNNFTQTEQLLFSSTISSLTQFSLIPLDTIDVVLQVE